MPTPASFKVAVTAMAAVSLTAAVWTAPQESKSAPLAKQLTQVLDAAKLDSIAAPDPAEPGTFVAALYIQGTQMLVVSAKYAAPSLLTDKLGRKEFREVYIDLNSASDPHTKLFVMDQLADGLALKPENDQPADTWELGKTQIVFDGDYKKAKVSETEYQKTFDDADTRYARILSLLLAQAKGRSGS
jgi:hypothetical protein